MERKISGNSAGCGTREPVCHREALQQMMKSSPRPLKIALDTIKRLRHELARHTTPEQRRDFARLEHLINEAQHAHDARLARAKQQAKAQAAPPPPVRRKRLWGRISSML
jgi:hypothetical protein